MSAYPRMDGHYIKISRDVKLFEWPHGGWSVFVKHVSGEWKESFFRNTLPDALDIPYSQILKAMER